MFAFWSHKSQQSDFICKNLIETIHILEYIFEPIFKNYKNISKSYILCGYPKIINVFLQTTLNHLQIHFLTRLNHVVWRSLSVTFDLYPTSFQVQIWKGLIAIIILTLLYHFTATYAEIFQKGGWGLEREMGKFHSYSRYKRTYINSLSLSLSLPLSLSLSFFFNLHNIF